MGWVSRGAAEEVRAFEGLCIGLREPGALAPDWVLTDVRGLNVTVRAGRRFARDVAERFCVVWVGRRGDASSTAVAMMGRVAAWTVQRLKKQRRAGKESNGDEQVSSLECCREANYHDIGTKHAKRMTQLKLRSDGSFGAIIPTCYCTVLMHGTKSRIATAQLHQQ
jgi:hypothetical protein